MPLPRSHQKTLISPIGIVVVVIPAIVLVSSIMICWCRLRKEQRGVVRQHPEQNIINAGGTVYQQNQRSQHQYHSQQQLQQQQHNHQSWSNPEPIEPTYDRTEQPPSYTSLISLEQHQQQRRTHHNVWSTSEPVEQCRSNTETIAPTYDRNEQPPSYTSVLSRERLQQREQQQPHHQSWRNQVQVAPTYDQNELDPSYNSSVLNSVPSSEDYQLTLSPKALISYLQSE